MKRTLIELIATVREKTVGAQAAIQLVKRKKYTEVQALVNIGLKLNEIQEALKEAEKAIRDTETKSREDDPWVEDFME